MADNARLDTLVSALLNAGPRHTQRMFFTGKAPGMTAGQFLRADCGTSACAGGWTILLFAPEDQPLQAPSWANGSHADWARALLGISEAQAEFLFFGTLHYVPPEAAVIAALKYLKDHPEATAVEMDAELAELGFTANDPSESDTRRRMAELDALYSHVVPDKGEDRETEDAK